jgi:hypothetical protein
MRERLPLVLSVAALAVAVLGFSPLAEAVKSLVVPPGSVGAAQLKANAVRTVKIKDHQVTEPKIATAAISTDLIKDAAVTAEKLAATPAANVTNSTNIEVASGEPTVLTFNSERFDVGALHAPSSSQLQAPVAGTYVVVANVGFAGSSSTGQRRITIRQNGGPTVASAQVDATSQNQLHLDLAQVIHLGVGDYVELVAFQNSGSSVSVLQDGQYSPEFSMAWIGPSGA